MRYLPLLLVILVFFSCKPDLLTIEEVNIELNDPEFAVPLINSKVSIQDALNEFDTGGFLDVDADNFMTLYYTGEVGSIPGVDIPELDDFELPIPDTTLIVDFGTIQSDVDFDFADATAGTMEISFSSNHMEDLTVIVTVENLSKNGVIVSETIPVLYDNTATQEISRMIDLSDSRFDLESDNIEITYSCRNGLNEHRPLTDLNLSFSGVQLDYIQGYVGEFSFALPIDTLVFDLFSDVIGGNLLLEDPSIAVTLNNGFGIPLEVSADTLAVVNENNETLFFNSILDDGVSIAFPSINEVGETKPTTFLFDQSNSNLAEVINFNPGKFIYKLRATTNPEQDSTLKGFVSSQSSISASIEAKLPLWLSANNFVLEETVDFDFESLEQIEQAEFKLITENGLPIALNVQAYFLNSNNVVIDSLFSNSDEFIVAAEINTNGDVVAPGIGEKIQLFDQAKFNNLENATQIRLRTAFATSDANNSSSRFYTDYEIGLKLGVKAVVNP